jgi:hypothetical protein
VAESVGLVFEGRAVEGRSLAELANSKIVGWHRLAVNGALAAMAQRWPRFEAGLAGIRVAVTRCPREGP